MRRVLLFGLTISSVLLAWACALNPQPYPPDSFDASADAFGMTPALEDGGTDAHLTSGDSGSGEDAAPQSGTDGAADADGESDAAQDAAEDAPGDAPNDASGD